MCTHAKRSFYSNDTFDIGIIVKWKFLFSKQKDSLCLEWNSSWFTNVEFTLIFHEQEKITEIITNAPSVCLYFWIVYCECQCRIKVPMGPEARLFLGPFFKKNYQKSKIIWQQTIFWSKKRSSLEPKQYWWPKKKKKRSSEFFGGPFKSGARRQLPHSPPR